MGNISRLAPSWEASRSPFFEGRVNVGLSHEFGGHSDFLGVSSPRSLNPGRGKGGPTSDKRLRDGAMTTEGKHRKQGGANVLWGFQR